MESSLKIGRSLEDNSTPCFERGGQRWRERAMMMTMGGVVWGGIFMGASLEADSWGLAVMGGVIMGGCSVGSRLMLRLSDRR